jgi:VanZ family protein
VTDASHGGSRRLVLWTPVALLVAYELYLSSLSVLPASPVHVPSLDKLTHAAYFFLTAAFAVRAARFGHGWSRVKTFVVVVFATLAYGVFDEWHQSLVPERDVEIADVLADVLGAVAASLIAERLWTRSKLETSSN